MKHIFCDLDGTLLQDFYRIEEQDIMALKKACNHGVKVSIATGRLDYEVKMLMDKYRLNGYRVSQNGGVVVNDQGEVIYKKKLTTDDVQTILNRIDQFEVLIFIETSKEYIIPKRVKLIEDFERNQPFLKYVENINIFSTIDQHEIITVSIWAEKNKNIQIKAFLDSVLPNELTAIVSSNYTLDITNSCNTKGNAIKHLCDKFQISLDDVYVIGDSYNDISMFEVTKNSYAMYSGDDFVKAKAKYTIKNVKEAVELILRETD